MIFKNCQISSGKANETRVVDILVHNGKINDIQGELLVDEPVVDIGKKLLIPGGIDPHVHFNEPGFTHHEDFMHGTASAARGGVTTIIDMPCTSLPPVTCLDHLQKKLSVIQSKAIVDYALWGGVCGSEFQNHKWEAGMSELTEAGVIGFKTYSISGMDTFPALSPDQFEQVLQKAKNLDILVGHHAEDPKLIAQLTRKYQQKGRTDAEAYWLARPRDAEVLACKRAISLAQRYGAALHIVHVSSAPAARMIAASTATCETCPHYLAFGKEDLLEQKGFLKTAPVVKTREDAQQLWALLAAGDIDFLATDHAPCTLAEKQTGSIWTDYGGVPGTELMINFAFSEGVAKGKLTLSRFVETVSTAAAKRFRLAPRKGMLCPGADADFAIIDPDIQWKVSAKLESKGQFTPFEGHVFQGRVVATYLRGRKIFDLDSGVDYSPHGEWIKPAI